MFRKIDVVVSDEKAVEGVEYMYRSGGGKISLGTCVRCEECQKACVSNAVTIMSFPASKKKITVNAEMTEAPELSYYEQTDTCLCDECGFKLPDGEV